jgi:hypothetical protein
LFGTFLINSNEAQIDFNEEANDADRFSHS